MQALLKQAISENILILNQQTVTSHHDNQNGVEVVLGDFSFNTKKLLFATNGFANQLTNGAVKPARAQVLITEPIANLDIKGTFHLDKGYYYFRNIGGRILQIGAYGFGFSSDGKLNIFDLSSTKILSVATRTDPDMKRPRPLMMTADAKTVRLYKGKIYVTITQK